MTKITAGVKKLNSVLGWAAAGAGALLIASNLYSAYNKYDLKGRVILITGGSRGLGLELARQFARKGANLVICSRTTSQLSKAKMELEKLGVDVLALPVDVSKNDEVKLLVRDAINHFGRIDVLVNNAGTIQVGPQDAMNLDDYKNAMDTNFWSALYTMHACLPHFGLQGEGRILNITSIGGKIAVPHLLPYSASKFALVGLSEGMHAELKKQNIHVTTVVPNLMRTGSPRNVTVKGDHQAEYDWFKFSDSLPITSQAVESAAKDIVSALEYGKAEAVLTWSAKLAMLFNGLAPSWMTGALSIVNSFLPENIPGGSHPKKGHELEEGRVAGKITAITDRAAVTHNQY